MSAPGGHEDRLGHQYPRASQSAREGRRPSLLLAIVESPDHILVLSPLLLRETERVLSYRRLQEIWPLAPAEIEQYTQALQDFAELVNPRVERRVVPGDQEDDPVLEAALSGRADVLCTLDRHFHHRAVLKFCQEHRLHVRTDAELLSILRDQSH